MKNFENFVKRMGMVQIPAGKIFPGIIEHEKFHRYKWLSPKGNKDKWYYRIPSMGIYQIPDVPEFYDTLDADLSEAVMHLHKKGVPTTPSCSGHFHDEQLYEDLWVGLNETCDCIRKEGIELINPEDGKEYFHKNPKFQIPFNKSHFVNQSIEHGKKGVLGIYDPFNNYYDKISKSAIKDSQTLKDGHVTIFLTSPVTESALKECWKSLTQTIVGE